MSQQNILEILKPTDLSLYGKIINDNHSDLLWFFPASCHWMPRTVRKACREAPTLPFHQAWRGQVFLGLCFHRATLDYEGHAWLQFGVSEADSVAWCLYGLGRDRTSMKSHCCCSLFSSNRKLGPLLLSLAIFVV